MERATPEPEIRFGLTDGEDAALVGVRAHDDGHLVDLAGCERTTGVPATADELALSDTMLEMWTRFARTGNPGSNWPRYDTADASITFDTPVSTTTNLKKAAGDFWDSI